MSLEQVNYLACKKLARLCKENNEAYKREQISTDSFCYELIRRAVFRVESADKYFDEVYRPWVEKKIYLICQNKNIVADLTQETLLRFFKYITPETWPKFPSLAHILSYLNKCGEAAVLSYYRKTSNQKEENDPAPEIEAPHQNKTSSRPIEHDLARQQMYNKLWECVKRNCNDADDYFLAEQLWLYEIKPRTIAQRFTDRFPHVSDIYKRKRNLVDRIKRDRECQSLVT